MVTPSLKLDKETYLKLKNDRLKNNESEVFAKESFCYDCFRLNKNCLCSFIKSFPTKIKYVILMHPMEAKKEKIGTGRICLASLENSQMIMGIDFTDDQEVNDLIGNEENVCFTMYPGEHSINVTDGDVSELLEYQKNKKQIVVFLIDGTWPCAKKMMKLSKNINSLPRVSFTPKSPSIFDIKEQPADFCLSTLESIHLFIDECNRRGLEETKNEHDQMLVVFKEMIKFQVECATNPTLSHYSRGSAGQGYSARADRKKSDKWLKGQRKIIHRDS